MQNITYGVMTLRRQIAKRKSAQKRALAAAERRNRQAAAEYYREREAEDQARLWCLTNMDIAPLDADECDFSEPS